MLRDLLETFRWITTYSNQEPDPEFYEPLWTYLGIKILEKLDQVPPSPESWFGWKCTVDFPNIPREELVFRPGEYSIKAYHRGRLVTDIRLGGLYEHAKKNQLL